MSLCFHVSLSLCISVSPLYLSVPPKPNLNMPAPLSPLFPDKKFPVVEAHFRLKKLLCRYRLEYISISIRFLYSFISFITFYYCKVICLFEIIRMLTFSFLLFKVWILVMSNLAGKQMNINHEESKNDYPVKCSKRGSNNLYQKKNCGIYTVGVHRKIVGLFGIIFLQIIKIYYGNLLTIWLQ
jgi:hypothetical protein